VRMQRETQHVHTHTWCTRGSMHACTKCLPSLDYVRSHRRTWSSSVDPRRRICATESCVVSPAGHKAAPASVSLLDEPNAKSSPSWRDILSIICSKRTSSSCWTYRWSIAVFSACSLLGDATSCLIWPLLPTCSSASAVEPPAATTASSDSASCDLNRFLILFGAVLWRASVAVSPIALPFPVCRIPVNAGCDAKFLLTAL
jgi:hypothetical protein